MHQNEKCRLCEKKAKLVRKSHIIPEFMYQKVYDINRRMIVVNLKNIHEKGKYTQTGRFEKYILCKKCEAIFSQYERHVSHVLFGGSVNLIVENQKDINGHPIICVRGFDYRKFKLCFLSILWRAHLSQNVFFKNIEISNCAEEIKKMLLENDAGSDEVFEIGVMSFVKSDNSLVNIVLDPGIQDIEEGRVALFFISGYLYFINLKPKSRFDFFQTMGLKMDGSIKIPILAGSYAKDLLGAFGMSEDILNYYFN